LTLGRTEDTGRSVSTSGDRVIAPSAYERRKAPDKVRAALVQAASDLIAQEGLARLTVDAVARAAGVTKGGLFHHFASKNDLITGVITAMIEAADEVIEARMAADDEPHGRFTRAYLENVFTTPQLDGGASARTVCRAMMADPDMHKIWSEWLDRRIASHAETDDNPDCALVRLAADGAWLKSLSSPEAPAPLSRELQAKLIALTRP
jgi:AcrR family transcriptional regulator